MTQNHPLSSPAIAVSGNPNSVRVAVAADTARFSLRIDPAQLAAASEAFGLVLPAKIGAASADRGKLAVCLGPDEWYLTAPHGEQDTVESRFAELYAKVLHSLVDIGHREVSIEIAGLKAMLALQSAIAFDITAMPVPSGRRTLFDKAQIVLVRQAEDVFRIEVWRSFSEHVLGLLQAASREIRLGI